MKITLNLIKSNAPEHLEAPRKAIKAARIADAARYAADAAAEREKQKGIILKYFGE